MNWNNVIKQLIREHMAEHGLSQAELSAKLGKGRSYIPNCLDRNRLIGMFTVKVIQREVELPEWVVSCARKDYKASRSKAGKNAWRRSKSRRFTPDIASLKAANPGAVAW